MSEPKPVTVRAVVAEAERLRDRAHHQRQEDPYASPYAPTEAAARWLCAQQTREVREELTLELATTSDRKRVEADLENAGSIGAQRAIRVLTTRAAMHERQQQRLNEMSDRARLRLAHKQAAADRDRKAVREARSPGRRIDQALAELTMIACPAAQSLDGDVISHGKAGTRAPSFASGAGERAATHAIRAAEYAEQQLDLARRRNV